MQVGAVLVLGGCIGNDASVVVGTEIFSAGDAVIFRCARGMLDLLGEPILYRIIENLQKSKVGPIFLVVDDAFATMRR